MNYTEIEGKRIRDFLKEMEDNGVTSVADAIRELDDRIDWNILTVYGSYQNYLASGAWRILRMSVISRDNCQCAICGTRNNLRVHHMSYDRGVMEEGENLVTLCEACHERVHNIVDETLKIANAEVAAFLSDYKEIQKKMLGERMAQLVNERFPGGIEGKRKTATIQVLRRTFGHPAGIPCYIYPDHHVMAHIIKKK